MATAITAGRITYPMERRRELLLLARQEREKWLGEEANTDTHAHKGAASSTESATSQTLAFLKRFSDAGRQSTTTSQAPAATVADDGGGGGVVPIKQPLTYARPSSISLYNESAAI